MIKKLFAKIVNGLYPLTFLAKSSIISVWQGPIPIYMLQVYKYWKIHLILYAFYPNIGARVKNSRDYVPKL